MKAQILCSCGNVWPKTRRSCTKEYSECTPRQRCESKGELVRHQRELRSGHAHDLEAGHTC